MTPNRLPPMQRRYYGLLDAKSEQRAFLDMKKAQRERYIEERGWPSAWKELTERERAGVLVNRVEPGFRSFATHMAWGLPADRRVVETRGRKLVVETFIRCTGGPKNRQFVRDNTECQGTSSELQVAFEDDRVTQVQYLD